MNEFLEKINTIFFDLEGPLSPQDNAYEVMGLLPRGHRLFEVISRYDDLLTLEGKENYEPGDTLNLIVPFLISEGISEVDIENVSKRAKLVEGARELIDKLKTKDWNIYIISTSYEQHAYNIAYHLDIAQENVYCTTFPLDKFSREVKKSDGKLLSDVTEYILNKLYNDNLGEGRKDRLIKPYLDWFYWEKLPKTSLRDCTQRVIVIGGRRKVWAIEEIVRKLKISLRQVVFIGDSITDAQATKAIEACGGLSVAFNGNAFVIPYATIGLATTNLLHLDSPLQNWQKGGRVKVKSLADTWPEPSTKNGPYCHWLVGRDEKELEGIIAIHKRLRKVVREEAGKLG